MLLSETALSLDTGVCSSQEGVDKCNRLLLLIWCLQEYKQKLARVTQVRKELKSHIQSLPDLSLLPNVTGGLAPLPSAGDLFSTD